MNIKTLLKKLFKPQPEKDAFSDELIDAVYKKRYNEIESLRKYDRGEKTINAPDLRQLG